MDWLKKTAKINAIQVKACSPPDSKDNDAVFFPGGCAIISKPASRGSSDSTNFNSAVPPENKCLKRCCNKPKPIKPK